MIPEESKQPDWYKDAVIYELYIRSFCDSNADGIGDLPGLIEKLDYLADLGVTALWLLPFYPSPLKDGGYDIADYYSIEPSSGTVRDWKIFLAQAHRRGLRVITELVLNHTSDQHEWFQRSRRAKPGSRWRDFYVWTDDPRKYKEARIIFKDFEASNWTWDPVAGAYYWHRFYSHQPDLNFDSPEVHKAIFKVIDFWLDQGVDGFRLDAIPYLYERENTSCENLPETHQFLKDLRSHVDSKYKDRLLLAEANAWPEVAAAYFGQGQGDECHMAFHFPLMPRLFMGVRMEDKTPIIDILEQMPACPANAQWALFLRNHDELTLEMVTDEERDYMYRVYAQDIKARLNLGIRRRLAPLLGNDRRKIELMKMLLLSMPGTPVLYYGDEIGMGDNIYLTDRNGVRTPMHWNSDKNAGFSRANPQSLPMPIVVDPEYHYEAVNVEAQQSNPNSLLWWTKRVIHLRKQWKAFGRGSLEFVSTNNRKVLAFLRRYEQECVLVVANLSRLPQPVELRFTGLEQRRVMELFGRTEFPPISSPHYSMTLSPHGAFWFSLESARERVAPETRELERISVEDRWRDLLAAATHKFERAFRTFLQKQPWFLGNDRIIDQIRIHDIIDFDSRGDGSCLAFLTVEYLHGDPEQYLLPLAALSSGQTQSEISAELSIAQLQGGNGPTLLFDAIASPILIRQLLAAIAGRRLLRGRTGECRAWKTEGLAQLIARAGEGGKCGPLNSANSSYLFEDRFLFKLFRRLEPGLNPEIEVGHHLSKQQFPNVPPLLGTLEYRDRSGRSVSLGVLTKAVSEAKNGWSFTIEALGRYFDRVQTIPPEKTAVLRLPRSLANGSDAEIPVAVAEVVGTALEIGRLLGRRTGELHLALSAPGSVEFALEPFTPFYVRSLYQSMRNRLQETLDLLRSRIAELPLESQVLATRLLERKEEIVTFLQALVRGNVAGMRLRCHGTYRLSEVLFTGKDFFIIDFEGDPSRSLGERQIKRPPSLDLATMLRSFDGVVHTALHQQVGLGIITAENAAQIKPWAVFWSHWVGVSFLQGYFKAMENNQVLVLPKADFQLMLECQIIDNELKELRAETLRRPQWVWLPAQALLNTIEQKGL